MKRILPCSLVLLSHTRANACTKNLTYGGVTEKYPSKSTHLHYTDAKENYRGFRRLIPSKKTCPNELHCPITIKSLPYHY